MSYVHTTNLYQPLCLLRRILIHMMEQQSWPRVLSNVLHFRLVPIVPVAVKISLAPHATAHPFKAFWVVGVLDKDNKAHTFVENSGRVCQHALKLGKIVEEDRTGFDFYVKDLRAELSGCSTATRRQDALQTFCSLW